MKMEDFTYKWHRIWASVYVMYNHEINDLIEQLNINKESSGEMPFLYCVKSDEIHREYQHNAGWRDSTNQYKKVTFPQKYQSFFATVVKDDCDIDIHLLFLDALFFGYFFQTLKCSKIFRKHLHYFLVHEKYQRCSVAQTNSTLRVIVKLTDTLWIDHKWNARLGYLLLRRIQLDDAMNWLNTLGGGYSALGDYFHHHAEEAGKIALKQLRVATEMGDVPVIIRCYLYISLSLMQRGCLEQAKHIIRNQYKSAKHLARGDHRLHNMCRGLWLRLKYTYQLHRNVDKAR